MKFICSIDTAQYFKLNQA